MSGLKLKMARLPKHDRLIIGKFRDGVDLDASNTSFQMQEDLEEDVVDVVDEVYSGEKGAEFYKRRRRNRYKRKTQITLEETKKTKDSSSGMKYVGIPVEPKTEGGNASKYVLLQFVKHSDNSEVHVIPVDDWYQFQKANNTKAITLDEVDIQYDALQKMRASANKKYQRISKAMEHNAKAYEENVLGKVNPGAKAEGEDSRSVSDIFGLAASRMKRGGSGAKAASTGTGSGAGAGAGGSFKGHLTEGGVDADGEREFEDICGYEYEETRSDDEEDAAVEQQEDIQVAERSGVVDEEDDEEGDDDDEEEEEEEENAADLVQASKELKGFLERQSGKDADSDAEKEKEIKVGSTDSTADGSEDRKRVRAEDGPGGEGKRARTEPSAGPAGAQEFELSEDGVRKFLELMGGRMTTKDLAQAFKKQIRDAGSVGKDRFKAIVVKVTVMAEDPVLGKILVVKGK